MSDVHQQPLEPHSPQARRILAHLTGHPCPLPEHRKLTYSRMIVANAQDGEPVSRFTDGRILFFGCVGCRMQHAQQQVKFCTPEHNQHHYIEILTDPTTGEPVIFPACHICQNSETSK